MFLPEDFDLHQWELTCHSLADNVLWRQVMEGNLRESARFEIHCWMEEREELRAALRFGAPADTGWQWGAVVRGAVTPEFVHYLLSLPKPANDGGYNKMTPFFTIALSNGFWSEHYGTQLSQGEPWASAPADGSALQG